MTVAEEEEILRQAARIRANRRRRLRKQCAVCGQPFEGIAQRRYCSDRCRMRASRGQSTAPKTEIESTVLPGRRDGESFRDFVMRVRSERASSDDDLRSPSAFSAEQDEQIAAIDRILQRAERVRREHGLLDDSTEILRREREARVRYLSER